MYKEYQINQLVAKDMNPDRSSLIPQVAGKILYEFIEYLEQSEIMRLIERNEALNARDQNLRNSSDSQEYESQHTERLNFITS